jgi:CMP-N,N'-diacetyllegionaminic acid synthase
MRVIAVIPARGGSKRLPRKNIFPLNGKPLIAYTIDACKESKFINEIYVSSDDQEILDVALAYGAKTIARPAELADDKTPKVIAIRQAVNSPEVQADGESDIVIIPQANSPQITAAQMDGAIQMMLDHNLWEVMSADKNGVQNAAFRVVKIHALFNEFLSAHCGFVIAENIDVHSIEDIKSLEEK